MGNLGASKICPRSVKIVIFVQGADVEHSRKPRKRPPPEGKKNTFESFNVSGLYIPVHLYIRYMYVRILGAKKSVLKFFEI